MAFTPVQSLRAISTAIRRPSRLAFLIACSLVSLARAGEPTPTPTLLERAFALDEGKNAKRDAKAAAELYRQAAAAGDAFAHLRLGYFAETGDGVPQDFAAARAHYQVAADAGLPAARVRLALCHLEGWGGPVDRAAFIKELRIAAEANDVSAQQILAQVYFLGLGVPVDRAEALRWLERAAKQDNADAQYQIGRQLEVARSRALMPDRAVSRTWFRLSAEQEYQTSMRAMARGFMSGPRSGQDWKLGQHWLELATETGDSEAPYILAFVELLHPDAPTRDQAKARAWLELAGQRGNDRAKEVLQIAATGRTLTDSMHYVLSEAAEDRYVNRANRNVNIVSGAAPTAQPPRLIRAIQPPYPAAAHLAKISGTVVLEFIVDTTGHVIEPKAVSSPHPLLSAAALETIVQWQFHPAEKDGRPVNTRTKVPIQFDLTEENLEGLDGILRFAAMQASRLGTVPAADYRELRLAKFHGPPRPPTLAQGAPVPDDLRVLLLIALDATGKPLRSYVMDIDPAVLAPALTTWALQQEFQPRLVEGKPVPSNVVYPYRGPNARTPVAN